MDRRVERTQRALHEALIALILEKGYEAVTVGDLLLKARVGRSTFYANYANKDALLQGGIDALGRQLQSIQAQHGRAGEAGAIPFAFSRALFIHAQSYRAAYRAMVGKRAGAVVADRMRHLLRKLVAHELRGAVLPRPLAGIPHDALVEFVSGAAMSVLMWWVDERPGRSADEVDAIFRRLALAGFPGAADPR